MAIPWDYLKNQVQDQINVGVHWDKITWPDDVGKRQDLKKLLAMKLPPKFWKVILDY